VITIDTRLSFYALKSNISRLLPNVSLVIIVPVTVHGRVYNVGQTHRKWALWKLWMHV